jgi:hypothetical protein
VPLRRGHWTRSAEDVTHAHLSRWPTEFDADYEEMVISDWQAVNASSGVFDYPSVYRVLHAEDPQANHPIREDESPYRIAGYFKDGFDAFARWGNSIAGPMPYVTGRASPPSGSWRSPAPGKTPDRHRAAAPPIRAGLRSLGQPEAA